MWIVDGLRHAFQMFWEVWWALVLGFALSGIVQAWVPRARLERALGGRRLREVFAGPASLLAGAAEAGDPLATLPALFHLMWRQELVADVRRERLGPATQVRAAGTGR